MNHPKPIEEKPQISVQKGTLAIDFGNTTTVVAFQGERDSKPELLDLPPISRIKGEVPSLILHNKSELANSLVGQEVLSQGPSLSNSTEVVRNFKRLIGNPSKEELQLPSLKLAPEKAGEILLNRIWSTVPKSLKIKRLVLTAPIESYVSYKEWLQKACHSFPVEEIALLDEPTAAAMGAGLPPGSKLLVLDFGGSTIDLSLVAIEGGEGRAAPIAELVRFDGQDLQGKSKQVVRCAKVLGKAGLRLGGNDIDLWIANHLFPTKDLSPSIINAAERLKCKLSEESLNPNSRLSELTYQEGFASPISLQLSRYELEEILIERGLLGSLSQMLKETLAGGSRNNCSLKDLEGVVLVGGGSRIPIIKNWLKNNTKPANLLTPPPIEAVAIGALSLTPGVTIKDILKYGISLRFWDKTNKRQFWHPLFIAGQTWPTTAPLKLIISASKNEQKEFELVFGEPQSGENHEVVYKNGIPTLKQISSNETIQRRKELDKLITMDPPGKIGEDCLSLEFNIDNKGNLIFEGLDLRTDNKIEKGILGKIR